MFNKIKVGVALISLHEKMSHLKMEVSLIDGPHVQWGLLLCADPLYKRKNEYVKREQIKNTRKEVWDILGKSMKCMKNMILKILKRYGKHGSVV